MLMKTSRRQRRTFLSRIQVGSSGCERAKSKSAVMRTGRWLWHAAPTRWTGGSGLLLLLLSASLRAPLAHTSCSSWASFTPRQALISVFLSGSHPWLIINVQRDPRIRQQNLDGLSVQVLTSEYGIVLLASALLCSDGQLGPRAAVLPRRAASGTHRHLESRMPKAGRNCREIDEDAVARS